MYRAIGVTLNKRTDNVGGISRIDIPAPPAGINAGNIDPKTWEGPWRAITKQEEIGFYICQANVQQYNQSEHTPFGSGYLPERLGNVPTSQEASDLLHGSLDLDPTRIPLQETKDILSFLSQK